MAKGGPEERECQKLGSVVAVGASESVSRNQLIKCELLKLKNGETPKSHKRSVTFAPVEDVFQRNREQFGLKRRSGARPLRKAEAGDLCTMRDLRLEVISSPKAA